MSAPHHTGQHPEDEHKHAAPVPPQAKLQRTLDMLLAVVSVDTLINLGVLITGVIVMAVELGWMRGA